MYPSVILITTLILLHSARCLILPHTKLPFLDRRTSGTAPEHRRPDIFPQYSENFRNHFLIERSNESHSRKRGLLYINGRVLPQFSACSSISWAWNWAQVPGADAPENIEFVPTLWGNRDEEDLSRWTNNAWNGIHRGAKYLLAFNEPDVEATAGGSSMAPQVAASVYRQHLNRFRDVALLVSPSVCNGRGIRPETGLAQGLDWLDEFYNYCGGFTADGCAVDRINVHWYYSYSGDLDEAVASFKSYLAEAYEMFEKRLWVTEFQLQNAAVAVEKEFIQRALPFLDSAHFVDRYSYFTADYMAGNAEILAAYVEL